MPASDELLRKLADQGLLFSERLRLAILAELDYWEGRDNPPNLSVHQFKQLVSQVPAGIAPVWTPRKSGAGPHASTGEDEVFKFEFEVTALGKAVRVFVKGYFFDKGNCRGVVIQTCRKVAGRVVSIAKGS